MAEAGSDRPSAPQRKGKCTQNSRGGWDPGNKCFGFGMLGFTGSDRSIETDRAQVSQSAPGEG